MYELYLDIRNFFTKEQVLHSEKNGTITIRTFLDSIDVMVGDCFQSGPYIDQLFRIMIARVPKKHDVENVLLLGLGGGGALREIHKRFPKAHITAVEYDPTMVEIARTIYLQPKDFVNVDIITDDVRNVIPKLQKKFDLIIVDLFIGQSLSPLLETDDFVKSLLPLLAKDGYMAMNFFRQRKEVEPIFDRYYSRWQNFIFNTNSMALYRHFGQGHAGDPVPLGYKDKRQSATFLKRLVNSSTKLVGNDECLGIQSTTGPITASEFVSDSEPISESSSRFTYTWWQPITVMKKEGWIHNPFFIIDHYQKGIGVIDDTNRDSYWTEWSEHARRHRKKWLQDEQYEMIDVDFDTFEKAYHTAGRLNWFQRRECMWILGFHAKNHPQDVRLFAARDKSTKEIVAGLALVQYDDISQSVHTTSFINKKVKHTSVGVGLIDYWYKRGIAEGIRFYNFGNVWKKGDPAAWKGYSKFKRQFNLFLYVYPVPMVKFVWRKKLEVRS